MKETAKAVAISAVISIAAVIVAFRFAPALARMARVQSTAPAK